MHDGPITTFLFTDIEGSTRLWEEQPERMREALARHDALARVAVETHGGRVVKTMGDGLHAAFADPAQALGAAVELQRAVGVMARDGVLRLDVRCGLHAGVHQSRDNDFYGSAVNRAARIMAAAHGGQVLASEAVAALVLDRLPDRASLRDLGRVWLRDLPRPERIFQLVHPELRTDFPALRSLENVPNNLPGEVNSFVGREREIESVRALVEQHRLVTLAGMGGLGKTRLARRVAAELLEAFPDGAWLVELGELADARGVAQAVASTLGIKEEPGRTMADSIVRHLADRRLFIVLDNCEHLLDECSALAKRVLAAASQVHLLATTREPLRVAGEMTFILPALEVPDLRLPFEPLTLMQNGAARLFIERARAASSDFEVTSSNAPALAAICHRLDGIPLALELAAARVRTLPLPALLERLADRFKLLRSGDRTASPRQQTLQGLLDWSYALLDADECNVLRQLSVFAGGWDLDAAQAVCTGPDDVVDVLSRLVEKSLVVRDPASGRYRLLETVRQYAQQRLGESGQEHAVRSAHLRHFHDFSARAQQGLIGPDAGQWLERLDLDLDNILAALSASSRDPPHAGASLEIANHLKRYWLHRGLLELGLQATQEALSGDANAASGAQRNRALFMVGQLHYLQGRYSQARRFLGESLAIARELGDEDAIPALLQSMGMAAQGEGDLEAARVHLEEALRYAERGGDSRRVAAAMNGLAQLEMEAADTGRARVLFERVVDIARKAGDSETVAIGLINLAMIAIAQQRRADARELLRETFAISRELGSRRIDQCVLDICAAYAVHAGEAPRAARFFGAAEAQARKTGFKREPADEAFLAPLIEQARRELGVERFEREAATGWGLHAQAAADEARAWLLSSPE